MGRFFPVTPRAGKPLSMRGLARGLARLEFAFSNMRVDNGRVDWSEGLDVPTLSFGDDGRGSLPGDTEDGSGLPSGGEQYQVLQRDGDGAAVWDWVRYVVPE